MSTQYKEAQSLLEQELGWDKRQTVAAHTLIIADNHNLRQALRLRMCRGLTTLAKKAGAE